MLTVAIQVQEEDGTWSTLNRQRASQSTMREVRADLATMMDQWHSYFSGAVHLRLIETTDW
jgi:hypothetical protein